MPDFWTHIISGELILDRIKDRNMKKVIQNNRQLFYFGCQGPDFFFYNDFWPWIKEKRGPEIGDLLHSESEEVLEKAINYVKNNSEKKTAGLLKVYLYGFTIHLIIDDYLHPYIVKKTKNFSEHKKIEIMLDNYIVKKFWGEEAYSLSPVKAIQLGDNLPEFLVEFYNYILEDKGGNLDYINDSYHDMKKVLNIFYAPGQYKRNLLFFLNKIIPIDISLYMYSKTGNHSFLDSKEETKIVELLYQGVNKGLNTLSFVNYHLEGQETYIGNMKRTF